MGRSYVSRLAFPGVPHQTEPPAGVLWIDSDRFRVPTLHVQPRRAAQPPTVVVYCHGNAMSISEMGETIQTIADEMGSVVLVPEIPGTQYDWGRLAFRDGHTQPASEDSYFEAARAAFDWARLQYPEHTVVVWGQSLGSGAACELAVSRDPDALVLQSPLLSCVRVAFPWFPTLPLTDIMVNIAKAPHFRAPTLVLHGTHDEVIPVSHGTRLAAAVPPALLDDVVLVDGAGHNDMEYRALPTMVAKVRALVARVQARIA